MASEGFMIAATGSGSGKTLITCGLLRLLSRNGKNIHSFKCGPDYIDPMFHSRILGIPSRNLDSYFCEESILQYLYGLHSEERDIAVVEGVMGYYDGIGGTTTAGSSYELARILQIPVILVASCKGMSLSAAAVIKGFVEYQKDSRIAGIILNHVSERIYPGLKHAIEESCSIPVIGYVPVKKELAVESRHLGLITPEQITDLQQRIDGLADVLETTLDIDLLLQISRQAASIRPQPDPFIRAVQQSGADLEWIRKRRIKIAVARDEAFCFLYQDNLNLLEHLGAELCFFSPLYEDALPEGISGLLLPGGYPELYAGRLSRNQPMLQSVKTAIAGGLPTLAECGGFLYLHEYLENESSQSFPLVGIIPGSAYRTDRLRRFGYVELTAKKDQLFLKKGQNIRAHEFHYWDSDSCGTDCHAEKASGAGNWECVHGTQHLYAGFPHIYFYGMIPAAIRLIQQCIAFDAGRSE